MIRMSRIRQRHAFGNQVAYQFKIIMELFIYIITRVMLVAFQVSKNKLMRSFFTKSKRREKGEIFRRAIVSFQVNLTNRYYDPVYFGNIFLFLKISAFLYNVK
jgi:hypothetical protein